MKKINRDYVFYELVFTAVYLVLIFTGAGMAAAGLYFRSREAAASGIVMGLSAFYALVRPGKKTLYLWIIGMAAAALCLTGTQIGAALTGLPAFIFESASILYCIFFPVSIMLYRELKTEKTKRIRRYFRNKRLREVQLGI